MKTFDEIRESHDESGRAWPYELLAMSVDELLDRMEKLDPEAYENLEGIISNRIDQLVGGSEEMPTFDEMGEIEDRLKQDISPEARRALMQKARDLGGSEDSDLESYSF